MLRLPSNLGELAKLAAKDVGKYAMSCVRVAETADGYEIVATDGKRLGLVRGAGAREESFPGLDGVANGATVALIAAKDWTEAFRRSRREKDTAILAALGEEKTTFAITGGQWSVANTEARFPNFDTVLPRKKAKVAFKASARLLAELLSVATAFSQDEVGDISFYFWHQDMPIALACRNGAGQEFLGLIMPIRGVDPMPHHKAEPAEPAAPTPEEPKQEEPSNGTP